MSDPFGLGIGWAAAAAPPAAVAAEEPTDITEDARTFHNGAASTDPHTFNHTIGETADFLLVKIAYENTRDVSDVKVGGSGGTSLTLVPDSLIDAGSQVSQMWYMVAPPTGVREIWIDLSAAGGLLGAEAVSLIDVDQADPIVDAAAAQATATSVATAELTNDGTNWLEVCGCDSTGTDSAVIGWDGDVEPTTVIDLGAAWVLFGKQEGVAAPVSPGYSHDQGALPMTVSAVLLRAA